MPSRAADQQHVSRRSYEVWRYQVKCLQKEGTPPIRMSLKEEASRMVIILGTTATIGDIFDKRDGIFRMWFYVEKKNESFECVSTLAH